MLFQAVLFLRFWECGKGMYWGDTYAEKAMMRMSGKIKEIYAEAAQDIDKKIQAYNQRFLKKDAEYRQKVAAGTMTQAEYDSWKQGQVFTGKRWKSVRDDIEHQINAANHTATDIVNGERQAVFVQNVNYAQYTIDKDFQFGLSFNLYDSATVTRLIRDDPDMLPAVGQDERKTDEWTRKLVSSAITQGVIQGESIPKISKRIAEKLGSSNEKSMTRIARTAMTSAQNAGRIEAMHNAQDMGIEVKKLWISTLDNRTRDAHRDLDGQTQLVDDPFKSRLGDIMFPGDPNAVPANVWHCRCALGWEYPEYKNNYVHKSAVDDDEETGEYLSYREWERRKRGEAEPEPIPIITVDELHPATLAGVPLGAEMSFEEADNFNVNPNYGKKGYDINCQSCVVVFEARLRGYDVIVKPNLRGSVPERLSRQTNLAWKDKDTGKNIKYIINEDATNPKKMLQFIKDTVNQGERYTIQFGWKGARYAAHIINLDRNENGEIRLKDNQRGKIGTITERSEWTGDDDVLEYLKRMKYTKTFYGTKYYAGPKLLRIDNAVFDEDIAKGIMEANPHGKASK